MSESSVTAANQQPASDAWGQPITEDRKAMLDRLEEDQRSWARQPRAQRDFSRLTGVRLTGADVFWLAKRALLDNDGDLEEDEERLCDRDFFKREVSDVTGLFDDSNDFDAVSIHVENADLSEAHLEGAFLGEAHFERSNLSEAHLEGADLSYADLQDANLRGAHLEGADLVSANLRGADLSGAHLEGTNLDGASLGGAVLRGSWFASTTVLAHVNLDKNTQLGDIHWGGVGAVDLTQLNWDNVPTLGDEHGFGLRIPVYEDAYVVRAYRQLATQLRAQGITDAADRFAYRAQVRHRRSLLNALAANWRQPLHLPGHLTRYLGSVALAVLAGYGYRPSRTVALYLIFIALFAVMYFAYGTGCHVAGPQDLALILAQQIPHGYVCVTPPEQPMSWSEAFVVSFTAFHGRGFLATSIKPGDPQAALAAAEAVLGLIIEISFIATFTQRFFGTK